MNKIEKKINFLCRKMVLKKIKQLNNTIEIIDGQIAKGSNKHHKHDEKTIKLYVHDDRFYRYLVFYGSNGGAEAYALGYWAVDNLTEFLESFLQNEHKLMTLDKGLSFLMALFEKITYILQRNNVTRSKRRIQAHYDLGNDFFKLFLDKNMMYSCALFPDEQSDLEYASENKLQHICKQLKLQAEDHILEIGTGWGGLAIYAAMNFKCNVTTTTISAAQFDYVSNKVKELGLTDKITVLNLDYRLLTGQYDKIVSIEMLEAVGYQSYPDFFNACNRLLKKDGLLFIQTITINDQNYHLAKGRVDFIKKYIFPGGCLPSVHVIMENIAKFTHMRLLSLNDIGSHYVKTLQHWQQRFNKHNIAIQNLGFPDDFKRLWNFYFSYCQAGFAKAYISDIQALWQKRKD